MATSMRFFLIACSLIFAVTLFGSARSWLWWSEEKPPAPPPPKPRTTTTPPPTKATTERSQKLNDNKAIEETNKVMERKGTVPARRRQMGIVSQKFNIVIAGYAGAGKSAAVNAFIGKKSGETGSAPEGNSGEITSQPRVYDNAKLHPNISVWDIPGGAQAKYQAATYFDQLALDLFDMILFFVKNDIPDKLDMNVIEQANEHEIPILVIHPMSNKRIDGQYKSQVISRYESSESVANFAGACELDKTLFEKVKLEYHAKAIKDYANELVSLRKINSAKYVPIQQFVISTRTLRGDFEYAMYELDEPQLRQHILRICETKCPEVQVESDKITKILNDALIWIFAKFDPWALRMLAAFICIAIAFVLHKMNYTFNWQQWLPLAFIMYFIYFMYSLNY